MARLLKHSLYIVPILIISCRSRDFNATSDTASTLYPAVPTDCHVVVAGGTTAALSAALTSARAGLKTCLVEPTDWAGGQLTASAVSAIDWPHHGTGKAAEWQRLDENIPLDLAKWMKAIRNPGGCSVSRNCYEPLDLLSKHIDPTLAATPNLTVLYNTVIKNVTLENAGGTRIIREVEVVRRKPKPGVPNGGYDKLLSEDVLDWYDIRDSERFTKEYFVLKTRRASGPIVIDATEWGEVLALSGASYVQGIEKTEGEFEVSSDTCGQAFVYPFVMRYNTRPVTESLPPLETEHPFFYFWDYPSRGPDDRPPTPDEARVLPAPKFDWNYVWGYRRIKGSGGPGPDQLSLQNWNPGNDYGYRYLLVSKAEAEQQRSDWKGGVNVSALNGAERHAIGWYKWLKEKAGARGQYISLDREVLGTTHGLAKLPYVRDTRRSIGVDDFVMVSQFIQRGGDTGLQFADSIGIGAYVMDIHGMHWTNYCKYPTYDHKTLPFHIPLRALTNRDVGNLLVAGKTMAQTFLVNSATRLQPIEWSSGVGAGAAAAFMSLSNMNSTKALLPYATSVQKIVREQKSPIGWTRPPAPVSSPTPR